MKKNRGLFVPPRHRLLKAISATVAVIASGPLLAADESPFKVDGYLKQELSFNAKNREDTPDYNDRGKLSMVRTTLRVNTEWDINDQFVLVGKFRAAKEVSTGFLRHLQNYQDPAAGKTGANAYKGDGKIMDLYDDAQVRELYADIKVNDRLKFRFGKQQVVWGETDFFVANDLVTGYDFTWRNFLEPSGEEVRKGNIMLKANLDVPELKGGIEAFIRPGWDRKQDIGTELDIYGGRWAGQSNAATDFRMFDNYNYRYHGGDIRKPTGGARWSGMLGDISYSVSAMRTFYNSPIMNSAQFPHNGDPTKGCKMPAFGPSPAGCFGEVVYPKVNIFGLTANGYSDMADAVFSTEIAYIKDAPFNFIAPAGQNSLATLFVAPGFDGYKKKNVIATMFRMDKNIAFTKELLGTEKPMFFSIQLFDKWIQNFKSSDNLLFAVGYGGLMKEHNTLLTTIWDLSYMNGRVHPQLVLGGDLTNGGGFAVPSVTFELMKDLRLKVEYDYFWDSGYRKHSIDGGGGMLNVNTGALRRPDTTTIFGTLHNQDQLYMSLTYQF